MTVIVVRTVGLKTKKLYHINCFASKRLLWLLELLKLRLKICITVIVLYQKDSYDGWNF